MTKTYEEALETKRRVTSMTVPDVSELSRRVLITEEYLEEQAQDQTDYYTNYQ